MSAFIQTHSNPTCALCGHAGVRIHAGLKDRLFGAVGQWNITKCQNSDCGLAWLDPEPLEEDIYKAYQSYYTHGEQQGTKPPKSFLRRVRSSGLSPLIKVSTLFCGLSKEKDDVKHMHLNELPVGRLLDIGCGSGAFLHRMKAKSWTVEGLDFDEDAVRAAREAYGVDARVGRLEDMAYASESFDAITMHHVIEHVFDPVSLMREIRRILKPRGRLVAVTPNINSWGHDRFGASWRGLEPPRHVRLFNSRALANAASAAGFPEIKAYSTAANAWSILASSIVLDGATKLDRFPEPVGPLIKIKALAMQCREAWLNIGNRDVGEECVLVAEK
jgi:2-polyprenyl-3-methyl-5-hydroxy-6-metoxy-1,4-benzoquinol methylase